MPLGQVSAFGMIIKKEGIFYFRKNADLVCIIHGLKRPSSMPYAASFLVFAAKVTLFKPTHKF